MWSAAPGIIRTASGTTSPLAFRRLLVVIKQTAYEEYLLLKLRGQAPKALRWKRLESRYKAHKRCVKELLDILGKSNVEYSCVSRVALDRQHLADKDLIISVGGDGTVLSSAHFLDHGTIPLLGINSDPITEQDKSTIKQKTDERRSHGALCMFTSAHMAEQVPRILAGTSGRLMERTRIQCIIKSTFSETRLVPALNDLLISHPSPAAVSRFRMGWLHRLESDDNDDDAAPGAVAKPPASTVYGTVTRFGGVAYHVQDSLNVWSSGMWVSTATGSTAAMAAAGGRIMPVDSADLQYLIREHMIEKTASGEEVEGVDNAILHAPQQLHLRWNSQMGRVFIDGSHLSHPLELGDEVMINNHAPPLHLFTND